MISIIIISYGRYEEVLDTLLCINRYHGELIEILFLDNNSTDKLKKEVINIFKNNKKIDFKYFHTGDNYGVACGRNFLIERAKGDIIVTLDDDIEINNINGILEKIYVYFEQSRKIGVIAFNIKNFYSQKALRHEIPHGNKSLDFNKNMLTYYFIGAGHAIRKDVYKKIGLYPLDLGLYGGEERDLSFRILENGYDILYASDIIIYHKVSPNGRMPRKDENFYRYRNQLIVLNRYMPLIYRFTSNIIWTIFFFLRKGLTISEIISVYKEILAIDKKTISLNTIAKMKNLKARLFF